MTSFILESVTALLLSVLLFFPGVSIPDPTQWTQTTVPTLAATRSCSSQEARCQESWENFEALGYAMFWAGIMLCVLVITAPLGLIIGKIGLLFMGIAELGWFICELGC